MDLHLYSPDNLVAQAQATPLELGYHVLHFYVDEHGGLARTPTPVLGEFYYSPSGGTLRDRDLNIVLYSARFDKFKGIGRVD